MTSECSIAGVTYSYGIMTLISVLIFIVKVIPSIATTSPLPSELSHSCLMWGVTVTPKPLTNAFQTSSRSVSSTWSRRPLVCIQGQFLAIRSSRASLHARGCSEEATHVGSHDCQPHGEWPESQRWSACLHQFFIDLWYCRRCGHSKLQRRGQDGGFSLKPFGHSRCAHRCRLGHPSGLCTATDVWASSVSGDARGAPYLV